jgi:hypothetical protein
VRLPAALLLALTDTLLLLLDAWLPAAQLRACSCCCCILSGLRRCQQLKGCWSVIYLQTAAAVLLSHNLQLLQR